MRYYIDELFCTLILVLLITLNLQGEENFYYFHEKKIPLSISQEKISIKFKPSVTQEQIKQILTNDPAFELNQLFESLTNDNLYVFNVKQTEAIESIMQRLKQCTEVETINPVYISNNKEFIPYNRFLVKFKANAKDSEIESFNKKNNIEVIERSMADPKLYILKVTPTSALSLLKMTQYYYENLPAEWSIPDFCISIKAWSTPNDLYFAYQYYLHNTKAEAAWDITKGSNNIKIAVVDGGGEAHADLPSNRLVSGYDFYWDDSDPAPDKNNGHGMACAGIIAATQNNSIGIAGISHKSKIMHLKIMNFLGTGHQYTFISDIIGAIDYAWQNGASIISNSWGYSTQPGDADYEILVEPFERAMTQGRGGLGCVIIAAAGNSADRTIEDYGQVSFPANVPGVMSIGAIDRNNNIQNYSPRGIIDVVAPSGALSVYCGYDNFDCSSGNHYRYELLGDVWSLDRPGQPGCNPGNYKVCPPDNWNEFIWSPRPGEPTPHQDYTAHFGGTSAACPQVAGLAALILAVNPNLYGNPDEDYTVQYVIGETADDLGSLDYDPDYGEGRINIYRAVLYAKYNIKQIRTGTISGTITENTLLQGAVSVPNNLTVNSGVTLVIEDNAVVSVASDKTITIHGSIIANDVTFQGISGTNWYGIDVDGSTTSYIKNSRILDCDYGVIVGGNCTISLYKDDIRANSVGVYICEDGNPNIVECYIQSEGEADILSTGNANGLVDNSSLWGTSDAGHKNIGSASTLFNYYGEARNIIEGRDFAISVWVLGGYPAYDNGKNYVKQSYGGNFRNDTGHTLYARYNYWGTGYIGIYGPVLWDPPLPQPPDPVGPSWSLPKQGMDILMEAWIAYQQQDYVMAKALAEKAFNDNKSSDRAAEALFLVNKSAYHLGLLAEEQEKLRSITRDKDVHYAARHEAIRWQMKFELSKNNIEMARSLALSVPDTTLMSREVLLDLAIGLLEKWHNFEEAEKVLEIMVSKYPDKESEEIKKDILDFYRKRFEIRGILPELQGKISMADSERLLHAHPNPFNLSTRISFVIPESDHVRLIIYDILGRKVQTLYDGKANNGLNNVIWNGKDENGKLVSSGVYICRLESDSRQEAIKILLAK
ncbi:MAG: S8 family serine peptidase [candidate division KSB1 bacterium]|nr:S8 family serine peptidase [candidate division KSB1 bacterium]